MAKSKGLIAELKQIKKDVEKNKAKVDKFFGTKPEPKKGAAAPKPDAPKKPKNKYKSFKLTKFKPELLGACTWELVNIDDYPGYVFITNDDEVVGLFSESISNFIDEVDCEGDYKIYLTEGGFGLIEYSRYEDDI